MPVLRLHQSPSSRKGSGNIANSHVAVGAVPFAYQPAHHQSTRWRVAVEALELGILRLRLLLWNRPLPRTRATVPAIQKLYDVCKASFSEQGPLSAEALGNVQAVLDTITPSDVGLECESQAVRFWKSPRALNRKKVFHSSPAIRYRHIYECRSFSIGIFCIPASSIIPLHDHPGMTILSKLLYGTVHVKSYDWIDASEPLKLSKVRPAKVVRDGEMSAPCGAMVLHPEEGGNVHAFKAITPCAILDILTPPYSSEDGRHCSYFRRCPKSDPSGVLLNQTKGSEFVWLEEYLPRDSFAIRRDLYTGPALNL